MLRSLFKNKNKMFPQVLGVLAKSSPRALYGNCLGRGKLSHQRSHFLPWAAHIHNDWLTEGYKSQACCPSLRRPSQLQTPLLDPPRACTRTPLQLASPSAQFCFLSLPPFHRCCSQELSLIKALHASLCLRVCSPRDLFNSDVCKVALCYFSRYTLAYSKKDSV